MMMRGEEKERKWRKQRKRESSSFSPLRKKIIFH